MRILSTVKLGTAALGVATVTLASTLVACRGNIVTTASLAGTGTAEAHFASDGKPLVFWADTAGKWTGGHDSKFPAHYAIDITSNGTIIGHVECDTKGASQAVCGSEVTVNDAHSGDCELKMACDVPNIPVGDTNLHVVATAGPGTSEVTKMSLNVRAK